MDLSPAAQDTGWDLHQIDGITMTDYELVTLFAEYNGSLQTSLMNYVAVLFAFLIAAYLIAGKLESRMAFIIVTLFTLVALPQLSNVFGYGHDVAAIAGQISARAAENTSSLGWHATSKPWGPFAVSVARYSTAVVLFVSYIGGLVFFFHQRHAGRAQ